MPDFDYDLGVLSMQLVVSRVKASVFLNRGVSSLTVIAHFCMSKTMSASTCDCHTMFFSNLEKFISFYHKARLLLRNHSNSLVREDEG